MSSILKGLNEGMADDFMAMTKARGMNARQAGTPEQERERTNQMLAQRATDREQQAIQSATNDAKILPQLKAEYDEVFKKYNSLGGRNWQYADREQNLTSAEREARSLEPKLNALSRRIHDATKQGVAEDRYDDMLDAMLKADGKRLMKKYSADVERSKDIESGKALNKLVKKNPGVLKTYNNAVKKDKEQGVAEGQLDELSPQTLANYKKKAGADATAADKRGDYKRGDKRMSGIMSATKKEFANDAKGVNEGYIAEGKILLEARVTRKLWESAGQKIAEAQLTADQINQIFGYVEKIQSAGGGNRTLIGKGKDAASAVNKAWEDLKTKVQNSGPVSGFDQMYDKAAEKLKQATGGDQGAMSYVQKYRDFAKKHPIAQSLIYSALIAAAGISGAGVGGAAALGLFKMVDKLLQGEKFSSAAYSGAKTGAMAYGASKVGDYFKGQQAAPAAGPSDVDPTDTMGQANDLRDKLRAPDVDADPMDTMGQANDLRSQLQAPDVSAATDVAATGGRAARDAAIKSARETIASRIANGDIKPNDFGAMRELAQKMIADTPGLAAQSADSAAEQAVTSFMKGMNESFNLSESQLYLVIGKIVERQRKLDEGIMDTIKGAAGSAMDWAKTKGTNLTTKVTADKLLQAWKKAGSPTDSLDVASIVQQAGVSPDTIKQVFTNMKIPVPGTPGSNTATRDIPVDPSSTAQSSPAQAPAATATAGAPAQQVQTTYTDVKKLVDQLDSTTKQRVVAALKKNLGSTMEEGSMGTAVSQPPGSTVSAGQRFYKPRHVPNQDELQKQGVEEEKQRIDPKCWTGYKKQGTKMKGGVRVNNCVPVSESSILQGLNQLDEGWKEKLAGVALTGALALGAGGAHARVAGGEEQDPGINRLTGKPIATQQATDTAPAQAEAPKGFSKEYLQKAANPERVGRFLISVEKAQELLKSTP
jgi:hypothetical protein